MSSFDDKHHLAMLAVPVLLSMLLGISGSLAVDASSLEREAMEYETEDFRESKDNRSQQIQENTFQNEGHIVGAGGSLEKKQRMKNAIESNNYEAFLEAAAGTPFADVMTRDAFLTLAQKYRFQKNLLPKNSSERETW